MVKFIVQSKRDKKTPRAHNYRNQKNTHPPKSEKTPTQRHTKSEKIPNQRYKKMKKIYPPKLIPERKKYSLE